MAASEFWVAYDYGTGGAWGLACAGSAREITQAFPELEVITERPDWMFDDDEEEIRRNARFVVADPYSCIQMDFKPHRREMTLN